MENKVKAEREIKRKEALLARFKRIGKSEANQDERIPPGQKLSKKFQVLDLGNRPEIDLEQGWKLKCVCNGMQKEFSLQDLRNLGTGSFVEDFHCVTQWSTLDIQWTGVVLSKIIEACSDILTDSWKFLIQYSDDDYTTNCPREDVEHENVFLAFELDGEPIPEDHGIVRILIPHLYGWKSAKFLSKIEFSDVDKPGFWETRGYSNTGNVWSEERFTPEIREEKTDET